MKPFPKGVDNSPPPIPDYVLIAYPSSSVATSMTVPTSPAAKKVRLACATGFWLGYQGVSSSQMVLPAAAVTDGTGLILCPANTPKEIDVEGLSVMWFLPVGASGFVAISGEFWG